VVVVVVHVAIWKQTSKFVPTIRLNC